MNYKNVLELAYHILTIMKALYVYDLMDGIFTEYAEIDGVWLELRSDYGKCDVSYEPYADAPRYQWLDTYFLREDRLEEVEKDLADFVQAVKKEKNKEVA